MFDRSLDCLADPGEETLPLLTVRPSGLHALLSALPAARAAFLAGSGFAAERGSLRLLPGPDGVAAAVFGLGEDRSPYPFGRLPLDLPPGSAWHLEPGDADPGDALLGFCLGAYHPSGKAPKQARARLRPPAGTEAALSTAGAVWMVRDLVNAPANRLGPAELAGAVRSLAERHGAACTLTEGGALPAAYPAVAAVGAGSDRAPVVAELRWGTAGPLISLVGKGVCFDSGGYDLKPSAAMLRMKKDMGGAAIAIGVARLVMGAGLPVRLVLRVGCAENSVSGRAMRPLDVIPTRRGLSVEIGNTDAEGRLVLSDLLAEASDEDPDLLVDFATLTGAARVALGPDLPALFCEDDALAATLAEAAEAVHDPVWRLPMWQGYDDWLDSGNADLNNVSSKPHAGAIVAALFLRRFVKPGTPWAHLDTYAWNDAARPGRPEGGEAQGMRAVFAAICRRVHASDTNQNTVVT